MQPPGKEGSAPVHPPSSPNATSLRAWTCSKSHRERLPVCDGRVCLSRSKCANAEPFHQSRMLVSTAAVTQACCMQLTLICLALGADPDLCVHPLPWAGAVCSFLRGRKGQRKNQFVQKPPNELLKTAQLRY